MVLTVTLNPAVDKTYTAQGLIAGHVNRMESMVNIPGGKGINVSKILCQYGCPVTATGFLGGYTGSWMEERLGKMGILCDFVRVAGETRCSMNIVAKDGFVTEILEPGPQIQKEEQEQFLEKYRKLVSACELVVMSGSAACGLPEDIYSELIAAAKESGKRAILDAGGRLLTKGIPAGPFLVKPNRRELEFAAGHRCRGQAEILAAAELLLAKGARYVAVSVGEKGMYLLGEGRRLFARAPRVTAVNTVGSGDSACAAFAMSILREDGMEAMLQKAVAISAANATTMESGCVPEEVAEALRKEIRVESL